MTRPPSARSRPTRARLALATLGMLAAALALIALATWRTAAAVLPLFGSCS